MLIRLCAVCFLAVASPSDEPVSGDLIDNRAPLLPDCEYLSCTGKVVAVTDRSITIKPEVGGANRLYPVTALLASGDYPRVGARGRWYKLADIKVGDKVEVEYDRKGGIEICTAVCMRRRPGGKVPAGHYPANLGYQPHERCQALQDFEEKGIPLPEKYDPRPYVSLGPPMPGMPPLILPAGSKPQVGPPPIPPAKP